ncbi:YafY family transcriptional regulator [bacterium]|nr:YafY family transcriptional regulator [bacterium]
MRRADRLFQIIQILRKRRITTAAHLADELEVSKRTIYRDLQDLIGSGVPIEGEAGVGYVLSKTYDFPPLMFTEEEIEALVLGVRIVKQWTDKGLAIAAGNILSKVEAALPENLKKRIEKSPLFSPNLSGNNNNADHLQDLRKAINNHRKLEFEYNRLDDQKSCRIVRPLCLAFMPPVWLLTAWCELRNDFRNFRIDRISNISILEEEYSEEPGKTLDDFFAAMK